MWKVPARRWATSRFRVPTCIERSTHVLKPHHRTSAGFAPEPDQPDLVGLPRGRRFHCGSLARSGLPRGVSLALYLSCALALGTSPTGCAQPLQMRLVGGTATPFCWWSAAPSAGVHTAILGIERRAAGQFTDQWLLSDHGVRHFQYRGRQLVAAGPPVSTLPSPEGFTDVKRWLQYSLPQTAPECGLPSAEIDQADSTTDLVGLAERHWSALRAKPPSNLSATEIEAEMEAFPHGVLELLAVIEPFG